MEHSKITGDQSFWEDRWASKATGWDIGSVSTPFKVYIDQLEDKDTAILIPGCGNAYEAEYLLEMGFKHITLIDISPTATAILAAKFKAKPQVKVLCEDFFQHTGQYNLILEQTFFCALLPELREAYVTRMHDLLLPDGRLAGLLFDRHFEQDGPPYGGSKAEYEAIFSPCFELLSFERCQHSIPQRKDTELWMEARRR